MALGYDEGTAMIKIGREEPVASMDSSGKIIWAHHNEIQTVNVKSLGADSEDVSTVLVKQPLAPLLHSAEHTFCCSFCCLTWAVANCWRLRQMRRLMRSLLLPPPFAWHAHKLIVLHNQTYKQQRSVERLQLHHSCMCLMKSHHL